MTDKTSHDSVVEVIPAPFPETPSDDHASKLSDPERLMALSKTGMLDPGAEEAFDRITRLATRLLGVEVSLMSMVDDQKQFFKSHDGLPQDLACDPQTPLSHSFCQYVVASDRGLAVHDARTHPLLAKNGAVDDMNVIAYLGEPIHAPNGKPIGSLCAIHTDIRLWSAADAQTLRDLAAFVENELELREEARERALVLREMQHRVKNLFSVSNSLLRLTARDADTKDELVSLLQGRLAAMSRSHDLALGTDGSSQGQEVGPMLSELVEIAIAPYKDSQNVSVVMDGPDTRVTTDAITYIALSFHELATNAAKYGAFSGPVGALSVRWEEVSDGLKIIWKETTQVAQVDAKLGFGSDLLESAVTIGLVGTYERTLIDTGLEFSMILPQATLH